MPMRRRRCGWLSHFEPDFTMTPQDFRFSHALRVRWVEVDMQKIVFNGHYLMYFDTAISDYWRALAMPYEEGLQLLGGDLYVKKATVEFHGSARFDDRLDVALRCVRIGNSSLAFSGAIFRGDDLLVTCELIYVFADPVSQTSKPVPQALRDLLAKFEAGGDMLDLRLGDWKTLALDATTLRTAVFVSEQGIAADLATDAADETALHAVAYNGLGQAVGTGRMVRAEPTVSQIGRLAVHRALRGSGVGAQIVQTLVQSATARGDAEVMLHAQRSAEGFYQRAGFTARGEYFEEAGRAHIEFFKPL